MMETRHFALSDFEAFDPAPNRSGSNWRFMCPAPGCSDGKSQDDKHRSLSYNSGNGLYNCKRCSIKGKVKEHWTHLQPTRKSAKNEVALRLQKAFHVPTPQKAIIGASMPVESPTGSHSEAFKELVKDAVYLYGTSGAEYLSRRGLELDICILSDVQYVPRSDNREVLIFPIKDETGNTIAFNVRSLKGTFKGITGPKKGGAFSTAYVSDVEAITITEAPIDALSLLSLGFPSYALCGRNGAPDWLLRKCAFKTVYIAFDADGPGDEAAEVLSKGLWSRSADITRLRPPAPFKDWNEALNAQKKDGLRPYIEAIAKPPFSLPSIAI